MIQLTPGRNDVVSYMDEMLLYHTTIDEQIICIRSMLETIVKFGLTIHPPKTFVATREVVFISYLTQQGQVISEPSLVSKTMAIREPEPTSNLGH